MNSPRAWDRSARTDRARTAPGRPAPSVILWRPNLVLPSQGRRVEPAPVSVIAEAVHRPASVKARMDAAWSILGSLAEARQTLGARVAEAEARAQDATSDRERVSATIDRYRAQAELDEVLTVTSTQMSALLKERGLR